jgi:hypothetical protein
MANILTTKEAVKTLLEDIAGTNSFDGLLDELILGVSQRFEAAANRKLFKSTFVEIHNGGTPRILVKNPPIVSVTSIVYAPYYDFATNGTTLSTSEYVVDPSDYKNKIYSTFGVFIGGDEMLKVTYVGGFVPADDSGCNIPDFIQQAATQQVVYLFKNRKTIGLDNVTLSNGTIHKISNKWLLPDVLDVITKIRYRNI